MYASLLLRLLLAAAVGTIIGLKTRTVAARMFAIICTAAALVTIVSTEFYQVIEYPWFSDPGRLSAQVIAALGFLGTGLIWISERNEVKGLSVSASIWVTAILGILIGTGLETVTLVVIALVLIFFFIRG